MIQDYTSNRMLEKEVKNLLLGLSSTNRLQDVDGFVSEL